MYVVGTVHLGSALHRAAMGHVWAASMLSVMQPQGLTCHSPRAPGKITRAHSCHHQRSRRGSLIPKGLAPARRRESMWCSRQRWRWRAPLRTARRRPGRWSSCARSGAASCAPAPLSARLTSARSTSRCARMASRRRRLRQRRPVRSGRRKSLRWRERRTALRTRRGKSSGGRRRKEAKLGRQRETRGSRSAERRRRRLQMRRGRRRRWRRCCRGRRARGQRRAARGRALQRKMVRGRGGSGRMPRSREQRRRRCRTRRRYLMAVWG
mmetsp:Transcript_39291/g.99587  ORF Transcript_39291/g.99587 Transcript_39291/m.99587 type:complete len:267 (-) Transcript_39291:882-1682(-)